MPIRDLSQATQPVPLEVEAAAAYEFLLSLVVYSDPDEFQEAGADWYEQARARAGEELVAAVEEFSAMRLEAWGKNLIALALETPPPRDVSSLVGWLEEATADRLMLHLLGHEALHEDADLLATMEQAVAGDGAAQERVIDRTCADQRAARGMRALFQLGPEGAKEHLLTTLRGWHQQVFAKQEAEILEILERDAQAKRELQATMESGRLVEVATGGVRYVPDVGIERILLVPSVVIRPWVVISDHRGTKILCYSVADSSLAADESAPPEHLVRLYKALGDESRLRILRLLAAGERQLTEIADELGVAKSTAHHHLVALRVAGLVRVTTGKEKSYSLREDVISEVSELLAGYLGG